MVPLRDLPEIICKSAVVGSTLCVFMLFVWELQYTRVTFHEPNKIILFTELVMTFLIFLYALLSFLKWGYERFKQVEKEYRELHGRIHKKGLK